MATTPPCFRAFWCGMVRNMQLCSEMKHGRESTKLGIRNLKPGIDFIFIVICEIFDISELHGYNVTTADLTFAALWRDFGHLSLNRELVDPRISELTMASLAKRRTKEQIGAICMVALQYPMTENTETKHLFWVSG